MKVYLLEGDDYAFDEGERWVVGIYSDRQKAEEAIEKDRTRYKNAVHPSTKYLSYDITEVEVQ